MIEKITQSTRLFHFYLAAVLLFSGLNFAQTASKNPIYGNQENELIEKRDLFSKHFLNLDGSHTAAIASGPIHYESAGRFYNIDNTIHPSSSSNYAYENTENLMESYFGATAHKGVKTKTKEGEVLEFLDTAMYWEVNGVKVGERQSADISFSTFDNKGYYNNLFGSIDAEFVVLNGKRKLNYIIPNAAAFIGAPAGASYLVFTEKVMIPGNWSYSNTESGLAIIDDRQQQIFLYNNPFSYDSTGRKLRNNNTLMTIIGEGNTLTIAIKVNAGWLLDTSRVFPITVDPTVTAYPTLASYNTGSVFSSDFFKEESPIGFGRFDDNAGVEDFLRGWARFNLSTVPDNAVISNGVTVNYYISDGSPDFSPANGHQLVFSQLNLNPVTASGSALYTAIGQFGYGPFVTAAINTIGWKTHTLTSATLQTDIANSLSSDYFSLGFMPQGDFFAGEYLVADGWDTNNPYLTFTYNLPLGVDDFNAPSIAVYPNPVENILTVAAESEVKSIKIFSLIGQLIQSESDKNAVDVSALSAGVYLVQIETSNGQTITKKIVKQ